MERSRVWIRPLDVTDSGQRRAVIAETAGVRDALLPHIGDKNEENLDRLVEVVG